MRISLLTIGDELLIGQVLNSNVQWMSERLTEIGWSVNTQLTVGDKITEIKNALNFLKPISDAIIIGGGLGPTHDDLTMDALADQFSIPLEYDADWINKVEVYFQSRKRVMSENNKKQGFLLKGATRIDNDCGTAAGQHFIVDKIHYFVVPGVPHEMKSMMERYILPLLATTHVKGNEKILQKTLVATGPGESLLALRATEFVEKVKATPNLTLAFLPSSTQVRLRLQMRAQNSKDEILFEQATEELRLICGDDFVGFDPATIEQVVIDNLAARNQTLALAESCTGGLIAHKLTLVSGASTVLLGAIVAYQNVVKQNEFGISPEQIQKQGVVSELTAIQMAEAIRKKWNTTYGISTTGYLGPNGGDAFASVGTVWIAIASESKTETRSFVFENNRERAKERASQAALDLLRRTF